MPSPYCRAQRPVSARIASTGYCAWRAYEYLSATLSLSDVFAAVGYGFITLLRVIVLTSSDQIKDANTAYTLGANSFLVKPLDFNNIVELGRVLKNYWLRKDIATRLQQKAS